MDRYCRHQKLCNNVVSECYLFTWSIPEVSMIYDLKIDTDTFVMPNGTRYYVSLCCSKDKMTFKISSSYNGLKCFFSMIIGSKTLLLSKGFEAFPYFSCGWYHYDLASLSQEDESFQNLQKHPNNSLDFICKIKYSGSISNESLKNLCGTSTDNLYNLRSLAAVLRNSPESLLKEKVILQVDEETHTASKGVLCGLSPVFAKMFEHDTKEGQENVVTITDIKMPVLKALISFLYTGKLPSCDFDFVCDLYYASDKYDIAKLRQMCVHVITPQISMENIHRVIKLAFAHDDELLRSTVMALIATNIETWFSTNDWINLVNDEPKIAAEVLNFFDL